MEVSMSVQIPYAKHTETGRIVHVREAGRGAACECVCCGCGERLLSKQGSKMSWHFAHRDEACGGALESALHAAAKQLVAESREIMLPRQRFKPLEPVPAKMFSYDKASLETPLGDVRPDILLSAEHRGERHYLLVEIRFSHAVDEQKRAYLSLNRLPCVEVDVRGVDFLGDPETLRKAVIHNSGHKVWIYHPKMVVAERARLDAALANPRAELDAINRQISAAWTELKKREAATRQQDKVEEALKRRRSFLKEELRRSRDELQGMQFVKAKLDPSISSELSDAVNDAADIWWDVTSDVAA